MEVHEAGLNQSLLFLDRHAADSGRVSRHEPYRSACRLFHCGLIDRTKTLDLGFKADIVDPIDDVVHHSPTSSEFEDLCDSRARELVDEAIRTDRRIQLLWSGGIDSTVAMIGLSNAANQSNCADRIQVLCSVSSIQEYRRFFYEHIQHKFEVLPVGYPISSYLDPSALVVTGEHGDQLYGSDFLQPYVETGLAFEKWQDAFPFALAAHEFKDDAAKQVTDYLEPLMDACPVPIITLFDFFWWLNYATKWQSVTLRIPANSADPSAIFAATRHFFRHLDFQHWSLFSHDRPTLGSWNDYKMPSKQYIYDFTSDEEYFATKEKEQSLRLVFAGEPKKKKKTRRRPDPDDELELKMAGEDGVGLILTSDFTATYVPVALF